MTPETIAELRDQIAGISGALDAAAERDALAADADKYAMRPAHPGGSAGRSPRPPRRQPGLMYEWCCCDGYADAAGAES